MINHISIAANEPERVANVLASEIRPFRVRSNCRCVTLPDRSAGFLVQGDNETPFTRPKAHETEIAIESRRRGVTPLVLLRPQITAPQFDAVEIETMHSGRSKPGDNPLAVRDRRGRAGR